MNERVGDWFLKESRSDRGDRGQGESRWFGGCGLSEGGDWLSGCVMWMIRGI